jgi:hypothetical protein
MTAACGCARVSPARPKWNTRCAIGITSTGSAAITSTSSTFTIWTWRIGFLTHQEKASPDEQAHPIRAHGMGGRQVRTGKEYGEIFDHHAVEFEYAERRAGVQPMPAYSRLLVECERTRGIRHQRPRSISNGHLQSIMGANAWSPETQERKRIPTSRSTTICSTRSATTSRTTKRSAALTAP